MEKTIPNQPESAIHFSSFEGDVNINTPHDAYSKPKQDAPNEPTTINNKIAYLRESAHDVTEYLNENSELDTHIHDELAHYAIKLANELEPLARIQAQQFLAKTALYLHDTRFTSQVHDWIDSAYTGDDSSYTNHLHDTLEMAITLRNKDNLPVDLALAQAPDYLEHQQAIANAEAMADVAYNPNQIDIDDLREDIVDQIHNIEITPNLGARHVAAEGAIEMVEELVDYLGEPSIKDVVLVEAVAGALEKQGEANAAESIHEVAEELKSLLDSDAAEECNRLIKSAEQENLDLIGALKFAHAA